MEFRILGHLEVRDRERVLALGGAKQRMVLALLLLRAGGAVSAERLIDEMWGERPPRTAVATVHAYVSRLRKVLPPEALLTEGRGYRLAVAAGDVDARCFERLIEEGRAARAAGDAERAARLLREGLALWRGPALADFAYEPFAQGEIARLEELRLTALEERVEAELACGRHAEVVAELEALIADQPLREQLRAQLMLALYRSGRQAEALRVYQDTRRALVDELGIEPTPALRELEGAILAQDPTLAGPPPAGTMSSAPSPEPEPGPEPGPAAPAPGAPAPAARKVVTVLFTDVVASSKLAAELDPEWLHRVIGRFFETAAEVVARHGGTIGQFIGDAVMAVFGVPRAHEDDAVRALRAAVELRDALRELNDELNRDWGVRLATHTAVNTGEVMTGDPALGRLVTGDTVWIAARLQDGAKPGEILAGERTAVLARGAFEFEPVAIAAKGRAGGLRARRVLRVLSWERPRGAPSTGTVFVGRRAELELLALTHERVVADDEPHLVAILGDPGVGKTTLVRALRERLGGDVAWFVGRCLPYGPGATYAPLGEILRTRLGLDETDTAGVVLDQLGEQRILGITLGLEPDGGLPAEEVRRKLGEAWVDLLDELAADGPAVVVVEDLHWAHDALLELLALTLRGATGSLLILATARPDLVERAPAWTAATANASQLRLEPLSRAETETMLDKLAGPLPGPLRVRVLDRAEGNPFFVEEALASLIDRGALNRGPGGWTVTEAAAEVRVPDSVHAVIAARIDLLPDAEREALQAAAVVGRVFWMGVVRELLDGSPFDVMVLEERGFVRRRRTSTVGGEREFVFRHALTREVAYGSLPLARRGRLHARIAEWLERSVADSDLLAHHYGRAFELAREAREPQELRRRLAEQAFRHRVLAAGRALQAADPQSAALLLSGKRDLCEIPDPDLTTVGEAGRLLVALGRFGEAVDLLAGFAESGETVILRELGVATTKFHRDDRRGAEYRRGQGYLEQAAAAGDAGAAASLAGSWKGVDEDRARAYYRRAHEIDPGDSYPLGSLLEYEIQASGDLSPVEERRDRIAAAAQRCREQAAEGRNLPWAYYDLGKFLLLLGLPYESLDAYAKAVDRSSAPFMVETSLDSLRRLAGIAESLPGLMWAADLLRLALRPARNVSGDGSITPPVVILAGGTSAEEQESASAHRPTLVQAFHDFAGTVIAGGTVHGVSGLAGDLAERHGGALRTLGYLPRELPAGAQPDDRYHELRRTQSQSFSPLEPLAYWSDLQQAGIPPGDVKLLGIGGGRVAAAEYAIALALGAELGIVEGSGRVADEILSDRHWSSIRRLTPLAPDAGSICAFIASAPRHFSPRTREM